MSLTEFVSILALRTLPRGSRHGRRLRALSRDVGQHRSLERLEDRICLAAAFTGSVLTYSGSELPGDRNDPETTGRNVLAAVDPAVQYELIEVKHGLASSHSRFVQTVDDLPVFGSAASVHQGPDGSVQTVHLTARYDFGELDSASPQITPQNAIEIASAANGIVTPYLEPTSSLVWFPVSDTNAVLAWQTDVSSVEPVGDFRTVVSAADGTVLFKKNRVAFDEGSGQVYVPNPYQTQGSSANMVDNNDATNATLDAERVTVTLSRLDSGTGLIRGEWADLSTLNSPTLADVDADETNRVYSYDRDDERFEQVVIYHSIDSIQAYFHSLGFDDDTGVQNGIRDFPTLANAHWFTDDQSFYSPANDAVHFGDGGVDDGEDADIVAHEYGHAIQHDQNANWGGGEMGAMGEGFGDYLAASFYAADGDPAFQAAHAACVGEWDATSYSSTDPPCLRRVDGSKMYPDDLTGAVHADGEIWSAALWDIRGVLGGTITDTLVLEHHFALPANATMPVAAQAILTADVNLNGGANQNVIRTAFLNRGILQAGPQGRVLFDFDTYGIGDTVTITVTDTDLLGGGPISVSVTSTSGDAEVVTLTEVAGEFRGTIASAAGPAMTSNNTLDVVSGDQITVTYNDADDGSGTPAVATDVAAMFRLVEILNADFSDDFGAPFDEGFSVTGLASEWHLSTGRGTDAGHTAVDTFYFGSGEGPAGGGTHTNNADGTITSPSVDLTSATVAELSFNHFLESESSFDFATVSIVTSTGVTQILGSDDGSLPTGTNGFETERFDLTPFVGQSIQIAFRFTSDGSVTNEGWYIDDVIVRADLALPQISLNPVQPAGAGIFDGVVNGNLIAGEVHDYEIRLDPNQTLSVALQTSATMQGRFELIDPIGNQLHAATATSAGASVFGQTIRTTVSGAYTVRIAGAANSSGTYNVLAVLNAAVEVENFGAADNNTLATAQNLQSSFLRPVGTSADRGGVVASSSAADEDWFSFTLNDGQSATIAWTGIGGTNATLSLLSSTAQPLANGTTVGNADLAIKNFVDTTTNGAADTYFINIVSGVSYSLVVTRSADFDTIANSTFNSGQDLSNVGRSFGHVTSGIGSSPDWYLFRANAGDMLNVQTLTPFGGPFSAINNLDPIVEIFDPTGNSLGADDNSAPDGRNAALSRTAATSGIYRVRVSASVGTSGEYLVTITGVTPPPDRSTLDVDGDGIANAATDGILTLRYLFGFRGAPLIRGVIGASASNVTAKAIEEVLNNSRAILDADGNGIRDGATDGAIILWYLFGFRDTALVSRTLGAGATRSTGAQIATFLDQFQPAQPPVPPLVPKTIAASSSFTKTAQYDDDLISQMQLTGIIQRGNIFEPDGTTSSEYSTFAYRSWISALGQSDLNATAATVSNVQLSSDEADSIEWEGLTSIHALAHNSTSTKPNSAERPSGPAKPKTQPDAKSVGAISKHNHDHRHQSLKDQVLMDWLDTGGWLGQKEIRVAKESNEAVPQTMRATDRKRRLADSENLTEGEKDSLNQKSAAG